MSDDLSRARARRANAAAPEYVAPLPFDRRPARRSRSRAIRVNVPKTHVVQWLDGRAWGTVHEGSERDCADYLEKRQRWWPDRTFRMVTASEAKAESRRKTWSVRDADHVPTGSWIMLLRSPAAIQPSIVKVHKAFGLSRESEERRTGVVESRYRRSGDYMVKLDDTELTICVSRADLIYPVPDNLVALERGVR